MAPARLLAYEQLPLALVPPPLQRVIHSCDCLWQAVQVCSLTLSHDGALSWEVLLCVNLLATTLTLTPPVGHRYFIPAQSEKLETVDLVWRGVAAEAWHGLAHLCEQGQVARRCIRQALHRVAISQVSSAGYNC